MENINVRQLKGRTYFKRTYMYIERIIRTPLLRYRENVGGYVLSS